MLIDADALSEPPAQDDPPASDDSPWRYGLFWGPLLGFPLLAAIGGSGPRGYVLDQEAISHFAVAGAAVLWILLVTLAVLLKSRMRANGWVIALYAVLWAPCLIGWPFAAGRLLDESLDEGPATPVTAAMIEKYTTHGSRGSAHRHLRLQLPDGETHTMDVRDDLWAQAAVGGTMTLFVRPGRLGWRWVADYRLP